MLQRIKLIKDLLSRGVDDTPADVSTIAPDIPLLVVGDIHGHYGALQQALKETNDFLDTQSAYLTATPHMIFAGDYVDRGECSAEVLEWLFYLQQEVPDRVTCLMGNHEKMLLEFIDDPAGRGQRWLRNGGLQTLASYRISGIQPHAEVEDLISASRSLEAALPEGLLAWLRKLPLMYQSGNVCVAHAAMDPDLSPGDQSGQTLLWGHNEFMTRPRSDGLWVVHGHTIVKEPQIRRSRISIDTGAYHSGRLTVAAITPGDCIFIQSQPGSTAR